MLGELLERRGDRSVTERIVQLPVADVLDVVALELAQRGAHGGLLVRL